jgi:hypothetical protein
VAMRVKSFLLLGALLSPLPGRAAAQGGTDVWVAAFRESGATITIDQPRNLTRRPGYDNQPSFSARGDVVYFTAIHDDGPSDIWRVPVAGGRAERVTQTAQSEYSATPTPDGLHLSVIRVELPDSTQRLWKFPLDGTAPSLVLEALRPVGYHVWVGDHTLGTFVLGQPNALVVADARTQRADTVARGIGRALVRVPGRDAFSFVQTGAARGDTAWVSEVDTRTLAVRRVAPLPRGSEYHVWTPGGRLVTASGSQLLVWRDGRWDVTGDLSHVGVKGISRLALSVTGDRLAFVAEDGGAP